MKNNKHKNVSKKDLKNLKDAKTIVNLSRELNALFYDWENNTNTYLTKGPDIELKTDIYDDSTFVKHLIPNIFTNKNNKQKLELIAVYHIDADSDDVPTTTDTRTEDRILRLFTSGSTYREYLCIVIPSKYQRLNGKDYSTEVFSFIVESMSRFFCDKSIMAVDSTRDNFEYHIKKNLKEIKGKFDFRGTISEPVNFIISQTEKITTIMTIKDSWNFVIYSVKTELLETDRHTMIDAALADLSEHLNPYENSQTDERIAK